MKEITKHLVVTVANVVEGVLVAVLPCIAHGCSDRSDHNECNIHALLSGCAAGGLSVASARAALAAAPPRVSQESRAKGLGRAVPRLPKGWPR